MPKPIPATSYPTLIELINETYFDKVEQISAAEVDDNSDIVCVALDGRKKLAVKVEDEDINIKLMGGAAAATAVKFAAPAKKKTCSKGISCGASCISATKVCRVKTTPNQKAQKQQIVKEAGGVLVAPAGKLAEMPKAGTPPEEKHPKGINNTIDEKYASSDPTDKDVANWVNERIEARTNPTPENVAQRVAEKIGWNAAGHNMVALGEPSAAGKAFVSRSVDRESFAKAMVASDDLTMKLLPNGAMYDLTGKVYPGYKGSIEEIEANWREGLSSKTSPYYLKEKDLAAVNKTIANPNSSEKTKKAARAKLARHNQVVEGDKVQMARAPGLAQQTYHRYQGTPEQRLQVHLDRFDSEVEGAKQDMLKEREMLKTPRGRQKVAESIPTGYDLDSDELRRRTPKEYLKFIADNPPQANDTRTKAQVKADYRREAAMYHPDNKSTGDAGKFRKVQERYERKMQEFE
jgi:hypothetical protein